MPTGVTARATTALLPAAERRGEEVGYRSSGLAVTSLTTDRQTDPQENIGPTDTVG